MTNSNPTDGFTSTYRYAKLNGVMVELPSINGFNADGSFRTSPVVPLNGSASSVQYGTSASGESSTKSFSTYDDMLALWDSFNGTGTTQNLISTIPGWGTTSRNFWTSSSQAVGYETYITLDSGNVSSVAIANNNSLRVALKVLPVVLDLNRDGILSYGQVTMDVNGDGALDITQWAGAQDGVLVWDKFGDGWVHNNSQYAFAQYATTYANGFDANGKAPTDLSGLAEAFDSNHDGVLNIDDAKFAEFKIWQDANQNGVSDAGEVRSLLDWGITEINLVSDGVVRTPAAGVTEAGRTTAKATDGSLVLVSDAAFDYRTALPEELLAQRAAEPVNAQHSSTDGLFQLGLTGPVLNLDAVKPQAPEAAQGDVAGPLPAQTSVKLFLYDMLQSATTTAATEAESALFASELGEHDQPQTLLPGHGIHTDASLDVLMQQALRGGDLS